LLKALPKTRVTDLELRYLSITSALSFINFVNSTHLLSSLVSSLAVIPIHFEAADMILLPQGKTVLVCVLLFFCYAGAIREFDRRSDLRDVPPVSELGWTVPLAGADNCITSTECE
jgi:hypothetical protein